MSRDTIKILLPFVERYKTAFKFLATEEQHRKRCKVFLPYYNLIFFRVGARVSLHLPHVKRQMPP